MQHAPCPPIEEPNEISQWLPEFTTVRGEHLPSSDPDEDEYSRRWAGPEVGRIVCTRRARYVASISQRPMDTKETLRHFRSKRARREYKRDYEHSEEVSLVQYDAAMEVLLKFGRLVGFGIDEPGPDECEVNHLCHICGRFFLCGFVGMDLGCPLTPGSVARCQNRQFRLSYCNQCWSWVDVLRYYRVVDFDRAVRGEENDVSPNLRRMLDSASKQCKEARFAAEVVHQNHALRRIKSDDDYYRRRARSLHNRGLVWPRMPYHKYGQDLEMPNVEEWIEWPLRRPSGPFGHRNR
jgi:hypothetical protein